MKNQRYDTAPDEFADAVLRTLIPFSLHYSNIPNRCAFVAKCSHLVLCDAQHGEYLVLREFGNSFSGLRDVKFNL